MIEAQDLGFAVGGHTILKGIDLALTPGRFHVIIGQSGAGKSTLMRLLSGELAPAEGRVRLNGRDPRALPPAELARQRAVLSQATRMAFPFTVYEVVRLGLEGGFSGISPRDRETAIRQTLARVGLGGYERRMYQTLSGGEQQRVQLARVLVQVHEPVMGGCSRILFLDEPTSSLDLRHQITILDQAAGFVARGGTVVAVLHDVNLAARYGEHVIALRHGRLLQQGEPAQCITPQAISAIFDIDLCVNRVPETAPGFVLPFPA